MTKFCLKYLQALTSNLQAETKYIVVAVKEINDVIMTLQNVRTNIETYHSQWFTVVEKMCTDVGTVPAIPLRCSHQMNRSNVPADSPSQYYCRSLSIPLLDYLLSEMQSCFSSHNQTALLRTVHRAINHSPHEFAKVHEFAKMYQNDLPSPHCVSSELDCWKIKWQHQLKEHGQSSLPSTPTTTLPQITSMYMYPNIKALVSIVCTLPVTNCSAERSFSYLKQIKTSQRRDCQD